MATGKVISIYTNSCMKNVCKTYLYVGVSHRKADHGMGAHRPLSIVLSSIRPFFSEITRRIELQVMPNFVETYLSNIPLVQFFKF